ncbi:MULTISPECIES: hypothetical protein [Staphylococcus]|uniref:Tetratricopeptide repeat protein n=1 Tax=Staphylococcus hsinchuensis TaxID=3051183 RepID=A0ABZ3EBV2_9STAP|nr:MULTISPECIES: hypothetical protein [unclassified Staphylococcus]
MSDIIPFPRSQDKLIREIKQSFNKDKFDQTYELFEQYEQQFELDEQMSLLKCALLYQMGSYLELREEAIILLKQGITKYDDLMIYYIKSLEGLGQYFEVVEVINQVIDEVHNHKTRMELYPIKERALRELEKHNEHASELLQQFDELSLREQINTILMLIDFNEFHYKETIVNILVHSDLAPNVVSIMLEYLRFAQYDNEIEITKLKQKVSVNPNHLTGLEHTKIKEQIIPHVIGRLEDQVATITTEALHLMNNHAILLYPIDVESIASIDDWIYAYTNYFKSMVNLEKRDDQHPVIKYLEQLDSQS